MAITPSASVSDVRRESHAAEVARGAAAPIGEPKILPR